MWTSYGNVSPVCAVADQSERSFLCQDKVFSLGKNAKQIKIQQLRKPAVTGTQEILRIYKTLDLNFFHQSKLASRRVWIFSRLEKVSSLDFQRKVVDEVFLQRFRKDFSKLFVGMNSFFF